MVTGFPVKVYILGTSPFPGTADLILLPVIVSQVILASSQWDIMFYKS